MSEDTRTVSEADAGGRLDRYIAAIWPDRSRSYWQRQIDAGRVLVNGRAEKAGYLLRAGQIVAVDHSPEANPVLEPPAAPGTPPPDWVVYWDSTIMVVNKPRGLVVHPSAGHWQDSVVHRLLPWLPWEAGEWRPGVVHRLDRDTSGLMVLARSAVARERLSTAIQERRVTRQYVAVVKGHPEPEDGLIDAPMGRDPRQRLRMAIVYGGREARTHYRTLAHWAGAALVECTLDTGRTHQIRVHLASVGHPVLGDSLYGGRQQGFSHGQLLHAARLVFRHPLTDEPLEFQASPPEDWHALDALGEAEVRSPWVFQPRVGTTTVQWLSQLDVSVVPRSS